VTGRDTVDLPTITIRENAYGAFVPGGEIALELPLGFRFIPGAITLGGFITANPVANSVTNNTAWNTGAFPSNVINPSVANDFFATLPRDGVNASSVVIITLPDTLPAGIAGVPRTLTIAGLRIESVAGRWDNAITGPVDITFHTGADTFGFRAGAVNRTLRPAWRTSNVSYIRVANFADFGVDFAVIPGGGGVGNVPTIVAGWLPADGNLAGRAHPLHHDRGVGRNITSGAGAWGNVASVRVEEVVPRSLWGTHGFTFTLVDADGNVHPYASIRSVNLASSVQGLPGGAAATTNETNHPSMVSANFINQRTPLPNNFPHIVNNVSDLAGIVQGGAQAGTRQNASVFFSEDGRSVSVDRLEVGSAVRDTGRLRLDAHFALTADVNFEGGIYIVVTHGGQALPGGFDRMDLPQVLVANVRRAIEVETEVTPVTVGFQTYSVADITVREVQAGDFRTGVNSIQLSLGEYHTGFVAGHQGNLQFVPITTANVRNHIDVRGAVNSQSRVGATLQPFHFVGDMLSINIGAPTRGDVPSYIHLSGLAVRAVRDVPQGYYQLVVRGSSVLNNENFFNNTGNGANMNVRVPANVNDPFLRPNESSWRRYAHGPMMVDYIEVTTPGGITVGQGDGQDGQPVVPVVTPDVTVFWAPGTGYQVNGAARTFAGGMTSINNAATGRTYLPITALVTALGGTFYWDDSNVGGNRYLTTTIPHAAYETVTWVFPAGEARAETVVIVDGFGSRAVTNAPFLTGTTEANAANNQRTFVPARGMINAHGLIAVDNAATGQTVISVR
ncbi:MAG: hypothetical protein FWB74_02230, partial [Defluviitaleaceae bacterium]|nr:hypothetical protein [Defluviitaleaceae bacterium]